MARRAKRECFMVAYDRFFEILHPTQLNIASKEGVCKVNERI
jgi:hypothetical protein